MVSSCFSALNVHLNNVMFFPHKWLHICEESLSLIERNNFGNHDARVSQMKPKNACHSQQEMLI